MDQIRVGTLIFKVDGTQHAISGDFTIRPDIVRSEELVGPDGSLAFKDTPMPGIIEGAVRDRGDLDVRALLQLRDVTVTAELANGKTWVGRQGTQTNEGVMNVNEGSIPVRFVFPTLEEVS